MNTKQIRILNNGKFIKLMDIIHKKFKEKHGIELKSREVCETIAKAIEDNNIIF